MNGNPAMRVRPISLVTTLLNEERSLPGFLRSLEEQSVLPQEFIVVDGGSTDRSVELLRAFAARWDSVVRVEVIVDPTCRITHSPSPVAKGRNRAVREAHTDIIACTDAGCVPAVDWLERITAPMLADSTVPMVGGWYEAKPTTYFEHVQALTSFYALSSIHAEKFVPSARSLAFRKDVWSAVGGFPEIALTAEDTLFGLKVRERGSRILFEPAAVVYWNLRPSVRVFTKLQYRYGAGDGFCRIQLHAAARCLIKTGLRLASLVLPGIAGGAGFAGAVAVWWWLPFLSRPLDAFRLRWIAFYPGVAMLKAVSDAAYVAGYARGGMVSSSPKFSRVSDATLSGDGAPKDNRSSV